MSEEIASELAKFAISIKYKDVPENVRSFAKGLTLKTVAGMLGGAYKPVGRKMAKIIKDHNLPEEAGVIGSGFKTALWEAALLNGFFAHASEYEDDRFRGGLAWDITVVPLLLSLAEKRKTPGKALLEALIAGLEIHTRTGLFSNPRIDIGFVSGAVGPAVGAARLLGLDAKKMTSAMGIAMSSVPVTISNTGADAHYMESAFHCVQGIVAAEMAQAGMSGNANLDRHLSKIFGKDRVEPAKMVANLGQEWKFLELGIKKYPCCFFTQRQIDVLVEVRKKHNLSYEDIESIEVPAAPTDKWVDRPNPKTEGDLQFSLQHVLAAAMLDGDVGLEHMTKESIDDPRLKAARDKVKVKINPDASLEPVTTPGRVIVKTRDGRKFAGERMYVIGSPEEPLTTQQFRALYARITRPMLSDANVKKTTDAILNMEELDDIRDLMDTLAFKYKK